MNWIKGFALVTCLSAVSPVSVVTGALADPAPAAAPSTPAATKAPAMSDADKRAKAADCSKQADAKKLHGDARKSFREACKRGK